MFHHPIDLLYFVDLDQFLADAAVSVQRMVILETVRAFCSGLFSLFVFLDADVGQWKADLILPI